MSTWIYLACGSHEPPLKAYDESGQHEYDLPQIRADIADRAFLSKAFLGGANWDERFRFNTASFLAGHQRCRIGIKNEYGEWYDPALSAENERLNEPKWSEPYLRDAAPRPEIEVDDSGEVTTRGFIDAMGLDEPRNRDGVE